MKNVNNLENFILKANQIHQNKFDYSKSEYNGARSKLIIICKTHGEFLQTPEKHFLGRGCKQCGNKKINVKNFILECEIFYKNKYSNFELLNNNLKIKFFCEIHKEFIIQSKKFFFKKGGCGKCNKENKIKIKKQQFIDTASNVHNSKYNYDLIEFIDVNKDMKIICNIHGEFLQRASYHLNGGGCPTCSNESKKYTHEEVLKIFNEKHQSKYEYLSKYNGSENYLLIKCPKHNIFTQKAKYHLAGQGCRKCAIEYNSNLRKLTIIEFIQRVKIIHDDKYDYSKSTYNSTRDKIIIICKIHGEFIQSVDNHLSGNGCHKCTVEKLKLNFNEVLDRFNHIHNNKYDYSKSIYINYHSKIEIICLKHGSFFQEVSVHMSGCGCPKCCNTNSSKKENNWLDTLSIPEDYRQYKICSIKNNLYYVDGFDPMTNTVYEFNGDFWHGNPKVFNPNDINPKNKIKFGDLYQKTLNKECDLIESGFQVISMWECDWDSNK